MRRFKTQESPRTLRKRDRSISSPVSLMAEKVGPGKLCQFLCPETGSLASMRVTINRLTGKDVPCFLVLASGPYSTRIKIRLTAAEPSCLIGTVVPVNAGDLLYLEAPDYMPESENDIAEGLFVAFLYITGG